MPRCGLALALGTVALLAGQPCEAGFLARERWEPSEPTTNWACYFGTKDCAAGGAGGISDSTKTEVANILKGIISNLSKHKSLVEMSAKDLKAGVNQEKNPQVKKAMLNLLGAFKTDKKAAMLVVSRLTNTPKASLAGVSAVLSKTAPPPQPENTAVVGKPAPQGPIVKK
jgi:hypothetical protein